MRLYTHEILLIGNEKNLTPDLGIFQVMLMTKIIDPDHINALSRTAEQAHHAV